MTNLSGFTAYKERTIAEGQRVKVYRNLHKDTYSIADATSGKVLGHADAITLKTASLKVSEAGRQRVLRERKKNVHAFVIGNIVSLSGDKQAQRHEAYYNPYKTAQFVVRTAKGVVTQIPLHTADSVTMTNEGVFFTGSY